MSHYGDDKGEDSNGDSSGGTAGGGDTDGSKEFVCYKETVQYFTSDGLKTGLTYKNNFTWEVDKYPEFENAFIEMRACPWLSYCKSDATYENIDWYYFCSTDFSKIKSTQKDMPVVSFTDGLVTGYKKTLDHYYLNWWERILTTTSNTVHAYAYVWQVRVVDSSGDALSDWVHFNQNSLGTAAIDSSSGSIVDDSGNTVGNRTDSSAYDASKEDSSPFYDDSGTSNNDENVNEETFWDKMSNYVNWTKQMANIIVDFPNLLSKVYSWLPTEIITAIAESLSFVIVFRFLGR